MASKKNTESTNTLLSAKATTVDFMQFVPTVGKDGKPLTQQQRAQAEAAIRAGANPQQFGILSPSQLAAWQKAQSASSQQKTGSTSSATKNQIAAAASATKTDKKDNKDTKTDKKDTTPQPTTIIKPPSEKPDDSWKEDLQNSYRTMANQQIEESNRQYDDAKSSADRQALSRGMGRSTYNNQILAGLDSDKVKAANKIRESAGAAYQQAALQQHNVIDQLNWEREKAAQEQANWTTSYYAGRQDAAQQQSNWQAQFDASRQDAAQQQANWQAQFNAGREDAQQQQANWQAQFDAQQKQQEWQNEYMQDEFKYKYNVGGAASGGDTGGTPAPNPNPNPNPDPNKGKEDPMPDPDANPSGPTGIPFVDDIWNWILGGNNNNNK